MRHKGPHCEKLEDDLWNAVYYKYSGWRQEAYRLIYEVALEAGKMTHFHCPEENNYE